MSIRKLRPFQIIMLFFILFSIFPFALAQENASAQVYYEQGTAYLKANQTEEALSAFEEAIAVDPTHAPSEFNIASIHTNRGELDKAIEEYSRVIQLVPDNALAHASLGYVYAQKNEDAKAVQELEEAVRLKPGLGWAHENLAYAYVAVGKLDAAKQEYEIVKGLNPPKDSLSKLEQAIESAQGTAQTTANEAEQNQQIQKASSAANEPQPQVNNLKLTKHVHARLIKSQKVVSEDKLSSEKGNIEVPLTPKEIFRRVLSAVNVFILLFFPTVIAFVNDRSDKWVIFNKNYIVLIYIVFIFVTIFILIGLLSEKTKSKSKINYSRV